jgi:hypothetical protein
VRPHDGWLDLVCTQDRILKIFKITGLTKVFGIYQTVDQAIADTTSDGMAPMVERAAVLRRLTAEYLRHLYRPF